MVDNPSGGKVCSSDRDPKVIFLRDCLNKVMRCGLVRRVVIQYLYWSIMIYITFYGQTRWFQKGTRTSQLTQHIVYESRSHFQERRNTNFFFLRFRFTKTRKCPQISAAAVFESSFFLDRTLVVGLRAFSLDSNLSGCGAQCRFTTCSNVSQDKKTTAEGYWWQNNNTPALLAGQKRRKQDFIEI